MSLKFVEHTTSLVCAILMLDSTQASVSTQMHEQHQQRMLLTQYVRYLAVELLLPLVETAAATGDVERFLPVYRYGSLKR
eukprot:SAG31_NODE_555_length_14169_cov_19.798721_6_plen_80_part_00